MGLDMYLNKRKYIWKEDRKKLQIQGVEGINIEKVSYIAEEVMYWRKANAIHKWFVDNIQDGNDDCKEYYASKEDLNKLLGIIKQVLANKKLANELLPCSEGFFFGGTEYDEYYFEELEDTLKALQELDDCDYYYSTSW